MKIGSEYNARPGTIVRSSRWRASSTEDWRLETTSGPSSDSYKQGALGSISVSRILATWNPRNANRCRRTMKGYGMSLRFCTVTRASLRSFPIRGRQPTLGKILSSKDATSRLLKTRNFEDALALTDAVEKRVYQQIRTALSKLNGALDDIKRLPPDTVGDLVSEVKGLAELVTRVEISLEARVSAHESSEE